MAIVCLSGQQKISLLLHEALLSQTTTGTSPSTSRLTTQHPNPKPRLLRPILPLQLRAICFSLHKCMLTCHLVSCWWCFAQGWGSNTTVLPLCHPVLQLKRWWHMPATVTAAIFYRDNSTHTYCSIQYTNILQYVIQICTAVYSTHIQSIYRVHNVYKQ